MPEAAKSPVVESRPPLRGTVFPATKPEVVDPLEKEKARRQREEEERIAEELRQRKELSKKITQEFELRKAEEKEKEGFRRIEAQAQREADAVEQRRKERDHRQADDEERRNAAEERDAAREAAQKARRAAWVRRLIIPSAIGLAVILVGVAFLYATRSRQEVQVSHQVDTKMSRAKSDMLTIKKAYEVYSMQHQGEWPGGPSDVYSLLKNGAKAFESPWGVHYMVEIQPVRQPNGTMIEQPVVFCQPPGMQEFRVPEAPKGP